MQLAFLYPILYKVLKPAFPNCLWSGSEDRREVALTFDDGPHPEYSKQLLKVLDAYKIPVSFFWLGKCVERSPELAKEIADRGYWLGLHGYEHKSFPLLSDRELKHSLEKTQQAISKACNLDPERFRDVRPPNGFFTPKTLDLLRKWNYCPIMWSVVPEDWTCPGVDIITQRVLNQVTNGSLIVLHDGFCGGKDVAETVAKLIPLLLDRGYIFVTVDRLRANSSICSN